MTPQPAGGVFGGGGGVFGAGGGVTRLASITASRKTRPLSAAATQMVRMSPSSGSNAKAVSNAPTTAPAVFMEYNRPMRRPICDSSETA